MNAQLLSMLFGKLYDQTNKMGRTQPILLFCKTVLPSVGRKMKLAALKATIHLAAKVLCFAGTLVGLKRWGKRPFTLQTYKWSQADD